ncbi:glycosyltransferase [Rhodopila sp.]|uniref:glycosyltransferase n=1 Tax=Rhodopila sp. TaxID=2480087 RepID=UPI003D10CBFD
MPPYTGSPIRTEVAAQPRTALLIEGWRGLNHSYGLINQYQILELLKIDGLQLFHQDLPFFNKAWSRETNAPNFSSIAQQQIDALAPAGDAHTDCVYRISYPFIAGADNDRRRTLTFMITELGLERNSLAVEPSRYGFFSRDDNCIVTTTSWSRDRIVEFGFAADKVKIVPLGVDTTVFSPLTGEERAINRATLNIRDDEIVFVNVGGSFWNKGVDLLLRAFAVLRQQGRRARLIVKDQRGLYGVTTEQTVQNVGKDHPSLLTSDTLAAISVISGNLSGAELRALYGIADCYVSPYRAEGFNLPVLEAIACGTSVIVTDGGATDDFCPDGVACRIAGQFRAIERPEQGSVRRYIEPDLEALISAMDGFAVGKTLERTHFNAARGRVLDVFNWQNAARQLAKLAAGGAQIAAVPPVAKADVGPVMPGAHAIVQKEVLDLIRMIRPWSMLPAEKVRVGNDYDGGYVLPAISLGCDVVLSIGVGSDVSFDLRLAEAGARILQFDHTIEHAPTSHDNFTFYKAGWGTSSEGSYLDFTDICSKLEPLGGKRPLLKFDIEGAEYDVFSSVDPRSLQRFEVIVCEIHDLDRLNEPAFFGKVITLMEKLTLHHLPVHLHANNYGGMAFVQGIAIPKVLEISLLRRDLGDFRGFAVEPIPGTLDRPNHPFQPDIHLNLF